MVGADQVTASVARLATPIPDALWAALEEAMHEEETMQ
jgi:hypothetical protein